MPPNRNSIFSMTATVLWVVLIFLLSSIPGQYLGPDTLALYLLQKIGHVVLFGVLSVLFLSVCQGLCEMRQTQPSSYYLSFLLALLFAILDELHQTFTLGRHPSIVDVAIDAFGAAVFLGIAYLRMSMKRNLFVGN